MLLHEHSDFVELIRITAGKRGIRDIIIEKDYWVTLILHELQKSEFKNDFIFKGGTSLSKGWNLIDRFSEDVDLLILGDKLSGKAKRARLKKIQEFVNTLPGLKFDAGNTANRSSNESRTCCFEYVTRNRRDFGSLLPYIKLEMGYRGGNEPCEHRKIQSYLGEELEKERKKDFAENVSGIQMQLLHPRRTLVEKLFALYSAYEGGKIIGKIRHYYDVYKLLELDDVTNFLGSKEYSSLKTNVAEFSRDNWPDAPLPPENKLTGTGVFNLDVKQRAQIELQYNRADYYYGSRPKLSDILQRIQEFQSRF